MPPSAERLDAASLGANFGELPALGASKRHLELMQSRWQVPILRAAANIHGVLLSGVS